MLSRPGARSNTISTKWKNGEGSQHICLNSSGGNYDEALRIIKELHGDLGLTTVVDQGAECFSACAFIFMFGYVNEGDEVESASRKLHTLGKLGFHSPSISLAGKKYPDKIVAREYRNGIRAIANLLEIDWDDRFPEEPFD